MKQISKILFTFFLFVISVIPVLAQLDLGLSSNDVWFDIAFDEVMVDTDIRIYAQVYNQSDTNGTAVVEFVIDNKIIGTRPVSVNKEDESVVFMDWTTPREPGSFDLQINLSQISFDDVNSDDNTVIIEGIEVKNSLDINQSQDTPLVDDLVVDESDGQSVSDSESESIDADIMSDQGTAQTNDDRTMEMQDLERISEESVDSNVDDITISVKSDANSSDQIMIFAERMAWNKLRFRPALQVSDVVYDYEWSFGDNEKDDRMIADHEYSGPGSYQVTLHMIDPDGGMSSATTQIQVGFFHLANWRLWVVIIVLALIIIVSAIIAGITDNIVGEPEDEKKLPDAKDAQKQAESDQVSSVADEPLSSDESDLDTLASTGMDAQDLSDELSLLEDLDDTGTNESQQESESDEPDEGQALLEKQENTSRMRESDAERAKGENDVSEEDALSALSDLGDQDNSEEDDVEGLEHQDKSEEPAVVLESLANSKKKTVKSPAKKKKTSATERKKTKAKKTVKKSTSKTKKSKAKKRSKK